MSIFFVAEENEKLGKKILEKTGFQRGELEVHHFPDGESLLRFKTEIKGKKIFYLASLDHPDKKAVDLMFFAATAKELGAQSVSLIAPYLGYMRQDKRFHEGEAVTSNIFAKFLSTYYDELYTVDPHLHRHKTLEEIFSLKCQLLHAEDSIVEWIRTHIEKPVLIGPDEESDQWVKAVATKLSAPYSVLTKTRHGDKAVEISIPDLEKYKDHTPVLVDDIISTARTMIETIKHILKASSKPPVCIGVHGIFAGTAYEDLKASGPSKIVTCNTIPHESNEIDLASLLSSCLS